MIRDYILDDICVLNEFYNNVFNVNKSFDEPSNKIKVIYLNDQIIGFIDYSILYERAELNYIYIVDQYKKQGFATKLMENMFNDLKDNDVLSITLEVNVNNLGALKLYEKCGFNVVSKREKYYKNGDDGYLMYREVK
jgi:ribosomal-protein-alanine N-acetyltransferase